MHMSPTLTKSPKKVVIPLHLQAAYANLFAILRLPIANRLSMSPILKFRAHTEYFALMTTTRGAKQIKFNINNSANCLIASVSTSNQLKSAH